jgi:zona occludens toxin
LADKGIHLKGRLQLGDRVAYVFVVSQNGQPVQTFWDRELVEAGYTFRPLGDCMGVLEWRGNVRAISCDLPVVNMVNERKG